MSKVQFFKERASGPIFRRGPDSTVVFPTDKYEEVLNEWGDPLPAKCDECGGIGKKLLDDNTLEKCQTCGGSGAANTSAPFPMQVELQMNIAPAVPAEQVEEECECCDGCGWYEGGKTIKTWCEKCCGTGIIKRQV